MKHAGIHWPENAGGEHPNVETILGMPGILHGCTLICSPSARYWYAQARGSSPLVIWRAIPRQGKLPAQLNWNARLVAQECLNLWDEQPHNGSTEYFQPLNELQFVRENGASFPGYGEMAQNLARLRPALRDEFTKRGHRVHLIWPAWVPSDDGEFLDDWRHEALNWNVIGLHCYGSAETMRLRYQSYRNAFPDHPIHVSEWNANHEGHDEQDALEMWADIANTDPGFLGASYYIWETNNAGERDLSIWGNPARFALFHAPPVIQPEEPDVPTLDPWQYWTPEAIATAIKCPVASIQANWPRLVEQLEHCGLTDKATWIAMLATVSLESARRFEPIHEFKNADGSIPDYWYTYDGGPEFHGRGFIQNTHRYNYAALGPRLAELWGAGPNDFDFVARPDDLLDPDVSAACAALYFRDHGREDGIGIPEAAAEGNWREVRRLVQGGSAGLDILIAYATALGGAMQPPVDESNAYGPNVPDSVVLQQNNWSCAVRSTYAALWSMAQVGQGEAVTYGDDGPRDVYNWMVPAYDAPGVGLLDHTGAGLAQMLRDHGYAAEHLYPATLAQAKDRAGRQPLMIGGDAWNHWSMVRGKTTDGGLILENPSPGHMGITDYLRDSWDRLGPMALVWVAPSSSPAPPSYEQLANLEGVAYHDNGVVIPALAAARISNDWSQVEAVIEFLQANDPHRA
jgi:hypothetical protein